MKKIQLLVVLTFCLAVNNVSSQVIYKTITTSSSVNTSICAGGTVTVPFFADINYISWYDMIFVSQLSDANGSFTNPTNIGSISYTDIKGYIPNDRIYGNYSMNATIPIATIGGTGYRIRVMSYNPSATGSDNGQNITVIDDIPSTPTITAEGATTFCGGGSVSLTASTGTSYLWSNGEVTKSITTLAGGSYTVKVTNVSGCFSAASDVKVVTVKPAPLKPIITEGGSTTFCPGGSVQLTGPIIGTNIFGNALDFDGINDFVNIPESINPSPFTGNTDHTIEFNVLYKGGQTGDRWLAWYGQAGVANALEVIGFDGATGKLKIHHLSAGNDKTATTAALTPNVWTHVALVYTGSNRTMAIYINGVYIETFTYSADLVIPANSRIQLGTYANVSDGVNFSCKMTLDEFRIWNISRTPSQIQANINTELAGIESGLKLYYNFNQGTDGGVNTNLTNLTNKTSGGYTGNLFNFTLSGTSSNWIQSTSSGTSYLWSNGATTQSITATTGGIYTLQVTNVSGCQSAASVGSLVTVNELPSITSSSTATTVLQSGSEQNSSLAYSATTGTPTTYSISWSGSAANIFGTVTDATLASGSISIVVPANTVEGTYSGIITVKNANGCVSTENSFTVTVSALPTISTSSTASSVYQSTNAQTSFLNYSATTSSPTSYSISWNGAPTNSFAAVTDAPLTSSPINILVPANTASGTYTGSITVKDANGFVSTGRSFTLTINAYSFTASETATAVCQNSNGITSLSYNIATDLPTTYSIIWTGDAASLLSAVIDVNLTENPISIYFPQSLSPGTYTGTITVKNTNGFVSSGNNFTFTVNPLPPTPIIAQESTTTFCQGGSVLLTATEGSSYLWSNNSTNQLSATTQSITVSNEGSYTVRVTNANGCLSAESAAMVVIVNPLPDKPTITTPTATTNSVVSTLAGNAGVSGSNDGTSTAATFRTPAGVATDLAGNVYVADQQNHTIRKITPSGVVSTLAGSTGVYGSANGTFTQATFNQPGGVATDASGNVYVADQFNHLIRKITPSGEVSTLAGIAGVSGSADGSGDEATFFYPRGVATDAEGNVYVADQENQLIRKITPSGVVSTLAGNAGVSGDANGIGSEATFRFPVGVATDAAGNIYVADQSNHLIRKITPFGVVSTFSGNTGVSGSANGTATEATFSLPSGVATDAAGNVYVCDYANQLIRKITPLGIVSTLAGVAGARGSGNGSDTAKFNYPLGVAVDAAGNVYVADQYNRLIRKVSSSANASVSICNGGNVVLTASEGNTYLWSNGLTTQSITVSAAGSYTVRISNANGCLSAESAASEVTACENFSSGTISSTGETICYNGNPTEILSTTAASGSGASITYKWQANGVDIENSNSVSYDPPSGLTVTTTYTRFAKLSSDASSFTQSGGSYVVTVSASIATPLITTPNATTNSVVSTLAGNAGVSGSENGTGIAAKFNGPSGLATDAAGNVYVADEFNHLIRKINPSGEVSTLAGSGQYGSNNGTGTEATFNSPSGVATDAAGNVYVADQFNSLIRKISPLGVVSTLAGNAGVSGSENGTGLAARFNYPSGVATDANGNVYVADKYNNLIRKITSSGVVSTLAGSGQYSSVDGTGTAATFSYPSGVATDAAGNVYVVEPGNNSIRKITPLGVVSTLAGSGQAGSADGTGTAATFSYPLGLATDAAGNVYVADQFNSLIRKITPFGVVSTLAGNAGMSGSVNGAGSQAKFNFPTGLATDAAGNVYVADKFNHLIRKISSSTAGSICNGGNVLLTASEGNTYLWSNGLTTQSITVSTAGSYTVRVTNANGCLSAESAAIVVPECGNFSSGTISSTGETICYNGNPAEILSTTEASGSGASITYKWQANGADIENSNSVSYDPPSGLTVTTTYTRFAKLSSDASSFTQSGGSFVVTVNPLPTKPIITAGGPTTFTTGGSVVLTSSAGSSYRWFNVASTQLNETTQSITVSTAGSYTVRITDANGCVGEESDATQVAISESFSSGSINSVGETICSNGDPAEIGSTTAAINNFAIPNNALDFDGTNDFIDLPSTASPFTGNADHTIEFDVLYKGGQTGDRWMVWYGTPFVSNTQEVIGYNGETGKIKIHHVSANNDITATTAALTPNVWTHVALVYTGSNKTTDIFINGVKIETFTFTDDLVIPANSQIQLGTYASYADGINFSCKMTLDEFRVWNVARTQAEIEASMHSSLLGSETGLQMYYNFDQGTANGTNNTITTITDRTSNARNASINNFALSGANSNFVGGNPATTSVSEIITYKWQANGVDIENSNSVSYDPPSGLTENTTYTRFAKLSSDASSFTQSGGSYVVTVNANYTITASAGTNGNISSPGVTTMSCDGTEDKTYTITPEAGYLISDVTVDGISATTLTTGSYAAGGTYVFTDVQEDHTIIVTFALACTNPTLTTGSSITPACGATTADLTAGVSSDGTTVKYYTNEARTNEVENPAAVTVAQTYYIRATLNGCITDGSREVNAFIAAPTADAPSDVTACGTYTLPALSSGNYFTGAGGTGTAKFAGDVISSSTTLYVYASSGTTPNCTDEHSFTITITPSSVHTTTVISTVGSYDWNEQTYTESGVYTGSTTNCVTEQLNLTINNSYTLGGNQELFVVTPTGTILVLSVEGSMFINDVKQLIQNILGINVNDQILTFAGKDLDNWMTIADYNIQKRSTLYLTISTLSPSTISVIGQSSFIYNGTAQGPETSFVTGSTGTVTYIYKGIGSTFYPRDSNKPTEVGTYEVIASVAPDDNYKTATSVPFSFEIVEPSLCPSSTAVTASTAQTVCVGTSANQLTANITTTGVSGTPTYAYKWYYNTTNSNTVSGATAISGATSSTFTPASTESELGDRWYFCVGYSTENGCGQSATDQSLASNAVKVTVNAKPSAPSVIVTDNCDGTSTLTAINYTGTLLWNTGAKTPSITVSNAQAYTVTQTVNGCISDAGSGTAAPKATPAIPTITANGSRTFCEGGEVLLSASAGNTRYASSVLNFSSQYDECGFDYSSCEILGKPDTYPLHGDYGTAWSPLDSINENGEYIELGFDEASSSPINFIDIYETLGAGSIVNVKVKNPTNGSFESVYTATAAGIGEVSRKLHITFPLTAFPVNSIRIEMNTAAVAGFNNLDAVAIGSDVEGVSYLWSNGETTKEITAKTSGQYTVRAIQNQCTSAPSTVTLVTVKARPTAVLSLVGSAAICTGESTTLSIAISGEGTDAWSGELSDGTPFSGSDSPIVVPVSPASTTEYSIAFLNGASCSGVSSGLVGKQTITVRERPSAAISGGGNICIGSSSTLTIDISGEGTVPWTGTLSDGTQFNGSSSPIVLTVTPISTKTYTIVSLQGEYCAAADLSGSATVTVNPLPIAKISYESPVCATGVASATQTGTMGGTYSSTAGLDIDPITGDINLETSTPGIYAITYSFSNGNCNNSTTASITINALPAATISYASDLCPIGTVLVTRTGTAGGTYSSGDGLVINTNTGTIDLENSIPGTYEVTYSFSVGTCANTATTEVTVRALPEATITYAAAYCPIGTATVTLDGQTGGTFSSTTGLVINASTGTIDLAASTPDTYDVTYVFSDGICSNSVVTTLTIDELPVAEISYGTAAYCAKGTAEVVQTGTTEGVYTSTTGLVINAATGSINLETSDPGTYEVTYTFNDGNCENTAKASITINAFPVVADITGAQEVCIGASTTFASTTAGGVWSSDNAAVATVNAGIVSGIASGTTTINYTVSVNGCSTKVSKSVTVNPNLPASVSIVSNATNNTICAGTSVTFTATPTNGGTAPSYQWKLNGNDIVGATNATYTTAALTNNDVVTVVMTSNATPCLTGSPSTSNGIPTTVNPLPVVPAIAGANGVCIGSTTLFTNTKANGTWTSASPLVATVSATGVVTGLSSGTSVISYTVTENGCSTTVTKTITVNVLPAAPAATGATICGSGSVTLTATVPSRTTVAWYDVATLGTALATTTSYVTPVLSASKTYFVEAKTTSTGCVSATRTSVVAAITASPSSPIVTPGARCGTGTVQLTAIPPAGATVAWFSSTTSTTVLSTANTYTTPSISVSTTYYVESRIGTTCVSARVPVVATVGSIPATPTTPVNGSVCGTGVVTVSATTPAGVTVDWYDAATGGNLLQSGTTSGANSYTTPSLSANRSYYAQARNILAGCLSTGRLTLTATVNALPAAPAANGATRCGPGTLILTATAPTGGTVAWYDIAVGGSALATTTSFTTPSISATTNYYVASRITTTGCVSATRTLVTATVTTAPALPTASDVSRCGTGTVVLTATPPAGATVAWFDAATGGTILSTANPYTTASISTTTNYYVESRVGTTCVSSTRTIVKATINPIPAAPTGTAGSRCGPGVVTISASTTVAGATIEWYATSTSTTPLGTGNSFTTPSISVNTTYYAAAKSSAGCLSARTSVVATINPLLAASASITGTTAVCPIVGTSTTTNYTAASIKNAVSYKWTIPAGAVITSATTGRTITVRFNTVAAGDVIKVQGVASTDCAGNPKTLALNTTACATAPLTILSTMNNVKPDSPVTPMTIALDAKVFPNPSLGIFNLNVQSSSDEIIHVRVMNLSGKILQVTQMTPASTISVARDVIPGMYLIEVRQGSQLKILKAVKL